MKEEEKKQKQKHRILQRDKITGIYDVTDEYMEAYKKASKREFIPFDKREYISTKIMFHKKLPKYRWKSRVLKHISQAYNGAGFTLVGKNYMFENNKKYKLDVYDINSAYQWALINKDYILSSKYKIVYLMNKKPEDIIKKWKNKKYIIYVEFRRLKAKFDYVDYNIYEHQLKVKLYNKKVTQIGWLCDVDLINLLKLYKYEEVRLYYAYVFKDVGRLDIKDFIKSKYEKLHSIEDKEKRKNYKTMLHICTYGKSAQMSRFDYTIRNKYVIIALYQSAYVRSKMINLFLSHKKDTAYIDTDCIFINSNATKKMKIGDKIGEFKPEYKNVLVYICRIKAYVIYQNRKRLEYKWSGLKTELTEQQLKKIKNGDIVKITEKRKNKKINFKIFDKYLLGDFLKL